MNLLALALAHVLLLGVAAWILHHRDVRVLFAIDGDTVFIARRGRRGIRMRLMGIDAPEARGGDLLAAQARAQLARLTGGRRLRLHARGRDRYRRLLGYIEDGGTDIGLILVRQGLARATGFRHERREAYIAAEVEARRNARGLWAATAGMPGPSSQLDGRQRRLLRRPGEGDGARARRCRARKG